MKNCQRKYGNPYVTIDSLLYWVTITGAFLIRDNDTHNIIITIDFYGSYFKIANRQRVCELTPLGEFLKKSC